jgi:hypothetical protein
MEVPMKCTTVVIEKDRTAPCIWWALPGQRFCRYHVRQRDVIRRAAREKVRKNLDRAFQLVATDKERDQLRRELAEVATAVKDFRRDSTKQASASWSPRQYGFWNLLVVYHQETK